MYTLSHIGECVTENSPADPKDPSENSPAEPPEDPSKDSPAEPAAPEDSSDGLETSDEFKIARANWYWFKGLDMQTCSHIGNEETSACWSDLKEMTWDEAL